MRDRRLTALPSLGALAAALLLAVSAAAVLPPGEGQRPWPDLDVRGIDAMGRPDKPSGGQLAGLARLERELDAVPGGELVVRWGPQPGTIHHLFRRAGFLTGPAAPGADPEAVARGFVGRHRELLGLSERGVKDLRLSRLVRDPGAGGVHLQLDQVVDGVEIFLGDLRVHLDRAGRVLSVSGDTAPSEVLSAEVRLTEADALLAAARSLGVDLAAAPEALRRDERGWLHFSSGPFESEPIVDPTWFPHAAGLVRAWRVIVDPAADPGWYQVVLDARTGQVLHRYDLVDNVATEGLAFREDPGKGPQLWLPFVDDEAVTDPASPAGWSGAGETSGNNCDVKDDRDGNNETAVGRRAAAAGADPLAFDFPFQDDPALDLDASLTNLFYLNSWLHDRLVRLGFDEASGNFQEVNFTGLGRGGDPVNVDAQDGSGRNNANFGTPPDGLRPRMQMFVWTYTNPNRDSGFDASVVTHELFHGVSNRLVGGAENAGCLGIPQGGAMGEAWSDFFPCSFWDTPVVGGYVVNNYVRGIRRAAYDAYPWGYGDLCNQGGFEVHRDGEIWAATLWDLRELFIQRYGFFEGRCKLERLVIDGMKLAPCRPTYVDMRDAILLAARLNGLAGDECLLWQGFAARGLGAGAVPTDACTAGAGLDSTEVPPECAACGVGAPSGVVADVSEPNRVTVRFTPGAGAAEHVLLRSSGACPAQCLDAEFAEVARGGPGVTELSDVDGDGNRLSAGQVYSYRVVASSGACAAYSECRPAQVTGRCTLRPSSPTSTPLGVLALRRPPGATCSIEVTWAEAASQCAAPGALRYSVYRSEDPAFEPGPENLVASVAAPATSWLDDAAPAAALTYVVRAEDLTTGGAGPHGGNEERNDARRTLAPQGLPVGLTDFVDDGESGELPGYRRTGSYDPNDWAVVSDANTRGGAAWHSADVEGGNADKNLHLPPLTLSDDPGRLPRLRFLHAFQLEDDYDGGVIEISTDGGMSWTDLIADVTVGGYDTSAGTGRTQTVAALMSPPNTNELWTGENASGFPTHDPVEVDLAPYAGTLDALLRFRLLVDPLATEPGGWYVDDLAVENVVTFAACAWGCTDPPTAALADAAACASATEPVTVTVDASGSTFGSSGPAAELAVVLAHDGPGSFGGSRWAAGPVAALTFPAGTPAGLHAVSVTVRGADTCAATAAGTVQLVDAGPEPPAVGASLRVARGAGGLDLSWTDVGAELYEVHVAPLGSDLSELGAGAPATTAAGAPVTLPAPAGTVFLKVLSAGGCGG